MYLKVQLPWNVVVPAGSLHLHEGAILQRSIIHQLLDDFSQAKAAQDAGYFVVVTTLDSIGTGRMKQGTGAVEFPVVFSAITFKLFKGEVLEGVVHKVTSQGVLLRCGPAEKIVLSKRQMPDYRYVAGETPMFMNDKLSSTIKKGTGVRFIVIGTRWRPEVREFSAEAGMDADYLGPVH